MARYPGVDWGAVDEVVLGCANQAGEDNRNVARMAALLSGLPETVPAVTVNRLCASGLEAVGQAARAIAGGDAQLVIAGGVESMSPRRRSSWPRPRLPSVASKNWRTALSGWRCINPVMQARYGVDSMTQTADNLAARARHRPRLPGRLCLAQSTAHRARTGARLAGRGDNASASELSESITVSEDEHPRPDITL